jgi:hypothetical protein
MNESGDRLNLKEESLLSRLGEGLSREALAAWILQEKERGMLLPFSKKKGRSKGRKKRKRKKWRKGGREEGREGGEMEGQE